MARRRRVYLFGIGSPEHQERHGYTLRGPHGTPVSTGRRNRCGHHNSRGAQCVKDRGHGGMHRSQSGKYWY